MSKSVVLIAAIVGIVLVIVGLVLTGNGSSSQSGLGAVIYLVGLIVSFIAWILGIVKTAMIRRWGWLIVTIILGTLGTLIYGIFGPNAAKA